jgi:uncharacterized protein (DUF305 family)
MKLHQQVQMFCAISVAAMLAACSDHAVSPTGPSPLDAGAPALVSATAGTTGQTGGVTIASAPAPSRSAANFEVKFMTDMIDHHHMAVMMAELCITKATQTKLRSFCENIMTAQMAEIEQMQTWLQNWYSVSHEPVMKPADEKMMDRLASLSGAEFEMAFMEMMIKHHEKAIREGRRCLDKAYHAELRELCEDIIRTQSAEIAQMEAWLCQWYGECR